MGCFFFLILMERSIRSSHEWQIKRINRKDDERGGRKGQRDIKGMKRQTVRVIKRIVTRQKHERNQQ